MSSPEFTCKGCDTTFSLPEATLERYPGWTPRLCRNCRDKQQPNRAGSRGAPRSGKARGPRPAAPSQAGELNLSVEEVLQRYSKGPTDGVFTDGACSGNPGPGGWGTVYVRQNEVVERQHGHDDATTNNRMELAALIAGYQMLPLDAEVTIYSDSQLCVRTINEWAAQWERRGWRRKGGPVKNLELVQQAYELAKAHPKTTLRWIKAHDGSRWNEYADSLATAYLRDTI